MAGPSTQPEVESVCRRFQNKLLTEWYHEAACGRYFVDISKLLAWMVETDTNQGRKANQETKNVGRLLRELHHRKAHKPMFYDSSDTIASALLVFGILLELGHGDLIHVFRRANIVDQHLLSAPHFYPNVLDELQKDELLRDSLSPTKVKAIIDDFDRKRWSYTPVTINYKMSMSLHGGNRVLPFLRKESINGKGGTAEVYQILIHEDYVNDAMRKAIIESRFYDKDLGWCYQLALKTYSPANKGYFDWEKTAFEGLRGQPGMVQHLGDYTFEEIPDMPDSRTYNILLEFGELDLDEFFADQHSYPPVRTPEIIAFWRALSNVAEAIKRLHNLVRQSGDGFTDEYHGWHADIKLDNILRVHGEFKLADFGFAKFKRRRNELPTEYIEGGTQTYGPPETDPILTPVTQTIDTWSFGCVLSVAATWVILGYQGILQYETLRKQAIAGLRKQREHQPDAIAPTAHDAFHNGRDVLPEVIHWHDYLSTIARRSDSLSRKVLGLVDRKMLLGNPKDRISSTDLCKELNNMLEASDNDYKYPRKGTGTHQSVLTTLLEYDRGAPANTTEAARAKSSGTERLAPAPYSSSNPVRYSMRGATGSVESAARGSVPRKTRRFGKSERLENIPRGKTAHRADDLERELKAQTHVPESSSISCLLDSQVEHAEEPLSIVRPVLSSRSLAPTPQLRLNHETIDIVRHQDQRGKGRPLNEWENPSNDVSPFRPHQTPNDQLPTRSSKMSDYEFQSHQDDTPNGTQGERQMFTLAGGHDSVLGHAATPAIGYSQSNPDPSNISPAPRLSRGFVLTEVHVPTLAPTLDIRRVREELDNRSKRPFATPKKDAHLKNVIKDRDIYTKSQSVQEFIVDNGPTMWPFWDVATYVLETLAMKLAGLDDDGLDLVFTIGDKYNLRNAKSWKTASLFRKAMKGAAPGPLPTAAAGNGQNETQEVLLRTDMTAVLGRVFDDYLETNRKRPMTLLILTDGLWLGSVKEDVVEKKIVDFVRKLNSMEPRRFSIQFISFGDHPDAIRRLEGLDDEMEKRFGIEDIIDTEPCTGQVWKMIAGSILEDVDEDEHKGPSQSSNPTTSPSSAGTSHTSTPTAPLGSFSPDSGPSDDNYSVGEKMINLLSTAKWCFIITILTSSCA
ncbi:serine/threonine protein kinase [Capronia coronata CBS 617.96]|uniref:Serine/threonine protein kinase n=1 Tax=Capronia coronata CBS 617.96 TaxID=1182541 RepID=W9YDR6_9EURO|nr:serine/threonine protein kinase [Capronia coronata CBS 617.96]EXJ80449.1 serine/threonine protein kinase [Capronia coronata CBS 617.96]